MSDDQSPRKASEVLLGVESDVKILLAIVKSQELNIRVLSNKLNLLMEKMDKQPVMAPAQSAYRVETIGAKPPPSFTPPPAEEKSIPVFSDFKLPLTESPDGFRRTSRPETYAGDNAYRPKPNTPMEALKFPPQGPRPPPGRSANDEVVVIPQQAAKVAPPIQPTPPSPSRQEVITVQPPLNTNAVPVQQRVVNKDNKTVFLADVDITDHQTNESVYKCRTSGNGKWMASLAVGSYRVTITKRESITKQKVEVIQDIEVDGTKSPLELPTIIIK